MKRKRKKSVTRVKGVTRIDDPGRHGVGWYARVTFGGKTHSKYFADMSHGGTRSAFNKALAWRNAKEKELGKPRTDRTFTKAGHRSPTGIHGVYRQRDSFVVAWTPSPGQLRRKFISILKYGREEALRRAIELRRKRERELYGRAVATVSDAKPRRRASASARRSRPTRRRRAPSLRTQRRRRPRAR